MASIDAQNTFSNLDPIRNRLRATIFRMALDVMAENDSVENHEARKALAAAVLNDPTTFVDRFALGASVGPFSLVDDWVAAGSPEAVEDSSLQWVTAELWQWFAAAYKVDKFIGAKMVEIPVMAAPATPIENAS